MRIHNLDPGFWHLMPAKPGIEASFKRWNLILIVLLAFVVLGAFVAGLGSEALHGPIANSSPSHAVQHTTVHS